MSSVIKKKILLTGSTGFIGKNILEVLGSSYDFFAPTHAELDLLHTQDVYEYLQSNPVDIIIHTANKGGSRREKDVSNVVTNNLRIFFNLLHVRPFYGRLITLGSGAEYDKTVPIISAKEISFGERIPVDDYGFYKYVCASFAEAGKENFITHLRLFGIYGKYEDYQTRFISNAICRALYNMPIIINQNVKFDYMYIADAVRVIHHFIEQVGSEVSYNVGSGRAAELKDIASIIAKKMSVPVITKENGLGKEYSCDVSRLSVEVGNIPHTSFESAIDELIMYYTSIKSTINPDLLCFD